jgi:hypothetical protein
MLTKIKLWNCPVAFKLALQALHGLFYAKLRQQAITRMVFAASAPQLNLRVRSALPWGLHWRVGELVSRRVRSILAHASNLPLAVELASSYERLAMTLTLGVTPIPLDHSSGDGTSQLSATRLFQQIWIGAMNTQLGGYYKIIWPSPRPSMAYSHTTQLLTSTVPKTVEQ